ncbi:hypothetical protein ACV1DN_09465 [Aeromonas allosaccharophila]
MDPYRYHYQLQAAADAGASPDHLTGTIETPTPLTGAQLRDAAIDRAPAQYLHFHQFEWQEEYHG